MRDIYVLINFVRQFLKINQKVDKFGVALRRRYQYNYVIYNQESSRDYQDINRLTIMKVFFWDFQDDNDIVREWILFTLNILVLVFTSFALIRTWRYYRQCMFQMMPLSINLIATFILLNLKLFEKGYEFDLIGHFIEIFTYFLFCYTFAIMYTVISKPQKRKSVQRVWNIVLLILTITLFVLSILVFSGLISKKCEKDTQQIPAFVSLVFQFLSFVPTGFYGVKILSRMTKKQEIQPQLKQQLNSFTSQLYLKQRKKQIIMVLATYIFSLIIRLIVSIVTIFMWDDFFDCSQVENAFIITSDYALGQVVLTFAEINQLLPHVVIPIAMYVVPLQKMSRKSKQIRLEQELIDEDEDDGSLEQNVQNRVSSILTSRLSQGSPTRKNNSLVISNRS